MRSVYMVIISMLCVGFSAYGNEGKNTKAEEHLQKCYAYGKQEDYANALRECDKAIARTDDKTIHMVAYIMKSISHLQLESYEQSIEDATTSIMLSKDLKKDGSDTIDILDVSVAEVISHVYFIRASSTYELAVNTIGIFPSTDKEKQSYRNALQDLHKAIELYPEVAEDKEIREMRNKLRRLAH